MLENPMWTNGLSIAYQKTEVQKVGSPKKWKG